MDCGVDLPMAYRNDAAGLHVRAPLEGPPGELHRGFFHRSEDIPMERRGGVGVRALPPLSQQTEVCGGRYHHGRHALLRHFQLREQSRPTKKGLPHIGFDAEAVVDRLEFGSDELA